MKVFVMGLDGCSWRLLDPWIARGELPFLRRLREQGCWGESESCLPPVTSPNWRCYATGTNPGKIGVFWWENIDFKNRRLVLPSSDNFHGLQIWEHLSRAGLKVAVINMPTTYPPAPVNGVLISGGPDALDAGYTYPAALENILREKFDYRVHPKAVGVIDENPEEAAKQILPLLDLRFRVTEYIAEREKPDFIHLTLYYINVLQHHLWDHPLVLEAWRLIDRNMAEIQARLPDWNLLFMVDHGTNRVTTQFNISTWMEQEGYLVLHKNSVRNWLPKIGLTRERIANLAAALGIKDWLKSRLGMEARSFIPSKEGIVGHAGRARLINWEKSQAIPSGQGPIYINPAMSMPDQVRIRNEIKQKLLNLRDDFGNPVALEVFEKSEIYSGSHLGEAPDLIIDQADGIHISASIGFVEPFQRPSKWLAENHKHGLFAALGPDMVPGKLPSRIRITDIAPTILHLYGLPVAQEMDGNVLCQILSPQSEAYQRSIRYLKDTGDVSRTTGNNRQCDADDIARRLADLGYL